MITYPKGLKEPRHAEFVEFKCEVTEALMRYVMRLTQSGRTSELAELGFTANGADNLARINPTQPLIKWIAELSPSDVAPADICNIRQIEHSIQYVLETQQREKHIDGLIELGASYRLMKALFGLTKNDIAIQRKKLGISKTAGRIRNLTEIEEEQVGLTWSKTAQLAFSDRLIRTTKETGLPVDAICRYLHDMYPTDQAISNIM